MGLLLLLLDLHWSGSRDDWDARDTDDGFLQISSGCLETSGPKQMRPMGFAVIFLNMSPHSKASLKCLKTRNYTVLV